MNNQPSDQHQAALIPFLNGLQDNLRVSFVSQPVLPSIEDAALFRNESNSYQPGGRDISEQQQISALLRKFYRNVNELEFAADQFSEHLGILQNSAYELELVIFYKICPIPWVGHFDQRCTLVFLLADDGAIVEPAKHLSCKVVHLFLPICELQIKYFWQFLNFNSCTSVAKQPQASMPDQRPTAMGGCAPASDLDSDKDNCYTIPCAFNVPAEPDCANSGCPLEVSTANSFSYLQRLEAALDHFFQRCIDANLETIQAANVDPPLTLPSNVFEKSWNFSPHSLSADALVYHALHIFSVSDCLSALGIDAFVFVRFLFVVQGSYRCNPYHNFCHALDTLQAAFYLYKSSGHHLGHFDLLALLVACITHDISHPGFNNIFLTKVTSPLATIYNDKSALENFHSAVLFKILSLPEYNFLAHLSTTEYCAFKGTVVAAILATDMAFHYDYLRQLEVRQALIEQRPFTLDCSEDRLLFIISIIKCADISNVARPLPIAVQWADALLEEFFVQGDKETACGIPIFPMGNRKTLNKAASQVRFIGDVAIPFFSLVDRLLRCNMADILVHLRENMNHWKTIPDENSTGQTGTEPENAKIPSSNNFRKRDDQLPKPDDREPMLVIGDCDDARPLTVGPIAIRPIDMGVGRRGSLPEMLSGESLIIPLHTFRIKDDSSPIPK